MPSDRAPEIVGFARTAAAVSASLAAQQVDLAAVGVSRMFQGPDALEECLTYLRSGDLLVTPAAACLADTAAELVAIEAALSRRSIGLAVLSLSGRQIDFREPEGKQVLAVLAEVAGWERAAHADRRLAGIAAAKAAGRFTGRRPTIRADDVRQRLQAGASAAAVARELGIGRSSVYRCRAGAP